MATLIMKGGDAECLIIDKERKNNPTAIIGIRRLAMKLPAALHVKIHPILMNENGATMIEYSLMVTFIAMAAFAAVQTLGTNLNARYIAFSGLFP